MLGLVIKIEVLLREVLSNCVISHARGRPQLSTRYWRQKLSLFL